MFDWGELKCEVPESVQFCIGGLLIYTRFFYRPIPSLNHTKIGIDLVAVHALLEYVFTCYRCGGNVGGTGVQKMTLVCTVVVPPLSFS